MFKINRELNLDRFKASLLLSTIYLQLVQMKQPSKSNIDTLKVFNII